MHLMGGKNIPNKLTHIQDTANYEANFNMSMLIMLATFLSGILFTHRANCRVNFYTK